MDARRTTSCVTLLKRVQQQDQQPTQELQHCLFERLQKLGSPQHQGGLCVSLGLGEAPPVRTGLQPDHVHLTYVQEVPWGQG